MRSLFRSWKYYAIAFALSGLVAAEASAQAQRDKELQRTAKLPDSLLDQDTDTNRRLEAELMHGQV